MENIVDDMQLMSKEKLGELLRIYENEFETLLHEKLKHTPKQFLDKIVVLKSSDEELDGMPMVSLRELVKQYEIQLESIFDAKASNKIHSESQQEEIYDPEAIAVPIFCQRDKLERNPSRDDLILQTVRKSLSQSNDSSDDKLGTFINADDRVAQLTTSFNEERTLLENKIRSLESLLVTTDEQKSKILLEYDTLVLENESLKKVVVELKTKPGDGVHETNAERSSSTIVSSDKALSLVDRMRVELDAVLQERDQLARQLQTIQLNMDQLVAAQVVKEREQIPQLTSNLSSLSERLAEEINKNVLIEADKMRLQQEIDDLANWKHLYEANHGMQELARSHRKLKLDNRRMTTAIDQLSTKLSLSINMNNMLTQSFNKLKADCGKPADFFYPEFELNQEYMSDVMKHKSIIAVLEEQISSLENEAAKLRQTVKDQVGTFTANGFKYASLDSEQLILVNEFANNLKNGNMNLPLNDRSKELLKENKKLKEDIDVFKLRIDRYEIEFGGIPRDVAESNQSGSNMSGELSALKISVQRLLRENTELQNRFLALKKNDGNYNRHNIRPDVDINIENPSSVPIVEEAKLSRRSYLEPSSRRGSLLLSANLLNLNLPPEDWTDEVKVIYAQLIECIEQLYERDQELSDGQNVILNLENTLITIKQHTAALYYDYAVKSDSWLNRENEYKQQNLSLQHERDNLKLKLQRIEEVIDVIQKYDGDTMESKLTELNRKLIIYQVNEANLSRRYTAQEELLCHEQNTRAKLENDFIEMETTLKKRILYLEQFKADSTAAIGFLQTKVDKCVPLEDYQSVLNEVEILRGDHLATLKREIEARVSLLKSSEQAQKIKDLQRSADNLQADLLAAQRSNDSLSQSLKQEQVVTLKAVRAVESQSTEEIASLVTELATYRGECSRLEVELAASKRNEVLAHQQVDIMKKELAESMEKVLELQKHDEEVCKLERNTKKLSVELKTLYDGGLMKDDAEMLRNSVVKYKYDLQQSHQEVQRHKVIAEISSLQAQSIATYKQQYLEEIQELQNICLKFESRNDDDLLIGKLQRQLMSTRASYKAFTRKYNLLRGNMRQRELALRALETRLDQREATIAALQDKHRLEMSALKKALRNLTEMVFDKSELDERLSKNQSRKKQSLVEPMIESSSVSALFFQVKNEDMVSINSKISTISQRVNQLAQSSQTALQRAASAEEESSQSKAIVDDLQTEKNILLQRCKDLELLAQGKSKESSIAARITTITEELKNFKLISLQQKRKIQLLQQEKNHLESIIHSMESNFENLENEQVARETSRLQLVPKTIDESCINFDFSVYDNNDIAEMFEKTKSKTQSSNHFIEIRPIHPLSSSIEGKIFKGMNPLDLSSEELLSRIKVLSEQLIITRKEMSAATIEKDQLQSQCSELQILLNEKDNQLAYCDRLCVQQGLPSIFGQEYGPNRTEQLEKPTKTPYQHHNEEGKLQKAASVTINSLKDMLDEKNNLLEKYREKIDELNREIRTKSQADLKADALLLSLDPSKAVNSFNKSTTDPQNSEYSKRDNINNKLLDQIDMADEILKDKRNEIQKMLTTIETLRGQNERLQNRNDSAAKEIEAMRCDMLTLAKKYQASEQRYTNLLSAKGDSSRHVRDLETFYKAYDEAKETEEDEDTDDSAAQPPPISTENPTVTQSEQAQQQIKKLQKLLKSKDTKITSLSNMLAKLKEEFVKSEEEHAIAVVAASTNATRKIDDGDMVLVPSDELRELKNQLSLFRDGLREAKDDADKLRKTREKLIQSKHAALEESRRLGSQLSRAEAQAEAFQDTLQRTRRELEEIKRKEVKLREKLRSSGNDGTGVPTGVPAAAGSNSNMLSSLQQECNTLRGQNESLRSALESRTQLQMQSQSVTDTNEHGEARDEDIVGLSPGKRRKHLNGGYVLGEPAEQAMYTEERDAKALQEGGQSAVNEYRLNMHLKWENQKKLQRRLTVIETRLKEKVDENKQLMNQLKSARDTAQSAIATKDELNKKVAQVTKLTQESRKLTLDDLIAIEQSRSHIYQLEEENTRLKRKVEVELANEIMTLRHKLASTEARVHEVSSQAADLERKQKYGTDGPLHSLRASEERYLLQEKLKDDLEKSRRQRLELEAAILDRDARALENRFDMESYREESNRLRKRVHELESAYQSSVALLDQYTNAGQFSSKQQPSAHSVVPGVSPMKSNLVVNSASAVNRSKREQELEGVIDAMKRVIEKLRNENDRLRRGGIQEDERKLLDLEKRYTQEKKKCEKLEIDIKLLSDKLKENETNNQKLIQQSTQLISMRKQLKLKQEEYNKLRQDMNQLKDEKDSMHHLLVESETKTQQLQLSLQQAHASKLKIVNEDIQNVELKFQEKIVQLQQTQSQELSQWQQKVEAISQENINLRAQIQDLYKQISQQNENVTNYRDLVTSLQQYQSRSYAPLETTDTDQIASSIPDIQSQYMRLKEENVRLRAELGAFDMEFFEEIENLKYAYSEAVQKLRKYEPIATR